MGECESEMTGEGGKKSRGSITTSQSMFLSELRRRCQVEADMSYYYMWS